MARCLVATGANLGDRRATLQQAAARLTKEPQVSLLASSELLETAPIGGPTGQDPFLNGALLLDTSLAPESLFILLQQTQQQLGRVTGRRWAARTLDLDLLLYEGQILRTGQLTLPHPRMTFRRFVLEPAAQIAPDMVHPDRGWTIRRLLDHLDRSPEYVAIIGPPGVGKTRLAALAAEQSDGRAVLGDHRPDQSPRGGEEMGLAISAQPLGPDREPTGQPWDRAIELLKGRACLLQASAWPDAAGPAISDFWFDQSLAHARQDLPSSQYDAFAAQWDAAREHVVSPKLVVWLDAPAEWPDAPVGQARPENAGSDQPSLPRSDGEHRDTARRDGLRRALWRQIRASAVGPFLDLDGRDLDDAVAEVVAAIQAMR